MLKNRISEGIIEQARRFPDKPAVIGTDGSGATYSDVVKIFETVRTFLGKAPIDPADRIAIASRDGIGSSLLALPVMEHAVLIALDPESSEDRFAFSLDLLHVNYIVTDDRNSMAWRVAEAAGVGILSARFSGGPGTYRCDLALERRPGSQNRKKQGAPADLAAIRTTSGTTSTPKIVPKTYGEIVRSMLRHISEYGMDEADTLVVLTKTHQNHSYGNVHLTLYTGGTAIVTNGFRHKEFIDRINEDRVTWFVTSPAVLTSLTSYMESNAIRIDSRSLRLIRSSGAPLPESTRRFFEDTFRVPVAETYGMTETGNITTTYRMPKGHKEGSVGVSTGLEIRILDGEILVRGDTVFRGYENPDESNDKYFVDGWFRTGDEGFLDEDGYLFITGRIKEMINRGGEKVSPYEVERALMLHGAVADAAAFPVPNGYGSEDVGAAVVLREQGHLNVDELRGFLQGHLPPYKMPTLLYVVDEIPVGKNEKVQRRQLAAKLEKRYPEQAKTPGNESGGALTETEAKLAAIWKKVLKRSGIGPEDDFFRLGGDSLLAAYVYSEIEQQLGMQVPINVLFHLTTLRELAAYIENRDPANNRFRFLVPIKESGYKTPLLCFHLGDGEVTTYHSIGRHMEAERPVYGLRFVLDGADWDHPLSFDQMAREYAKEIRILDPCGPYNLTGTCFGGVLAYAVAQALAGEGKEIAMLAMLDSTYPKNAEKKRALLPLMINSFHELRGYDFAKVIRMTTRKTRTMIRLLRKPFQTKKYLKKVRGEVPAGVGTKDQRAALAYAHNYYKAESFSGTIHYFRTTKDRVKDTAPQAFWKRLAGAFHIVDMPCRHNAINSPENSIFLVEQLCAIMEESNA